jgi:molecular chaperone DnaJ
MSTKDFLEKDYYKALGVSKTAKPAEIKAAYRKLARKYHPDANKGDSSAEERFKEISEAYSVLSDDKRRKEYDEARSLFGGGGFRVPTGQRPGQGGFGFDLGDLFGNSGGGSGDGGGLGDLFGGVFNRGGRTTAANRPRRGADVETESTLSFGDAIDGTTVSLRLTGEGPCPTCHGTGAKAGTLPRMCPSCDGTGQSNRNLGSFGIAEPCKECHGRGLVVDDPCPACTGSGRAMSSRTIQTRIPAGVADGQRIKIPGKGAPGERGGPAGDLYVRVHVKPHPVFGRSGSNLTVTVPVTFAELTLGAEVKVPAHRGAPVTVRIPPGTPNGRTFRVSGKGVRRKDGTTGALLVTVEVMVPQNLNGKARSALEDLREATAGQDPREDLLERAKEA